VSGFTTALRFMEGDAKEEEASMTTAIPRSIRTLGAAIALAAGAAFASDAPDPAIGADVGTGWNVLTIPAAAFTPRGSDVAFSDDQYGYRYAAGGSSQYHEFRAPVFLPSGAGIGKLTLYAYDSHSGAEIRAYLQRFSGTGMQCAGGSLCTPGSAPAEQTLGSAGTAGTPGYVSVSEAVAPHTVNNYLPSGGGVYAVTVRTNSNDSSVKWKGVDLWWRRQISDAPTSASFTDVPSNAQFFAEIEAMKAAGITAGCTATTFCPDSNVTRRQMAAFFVRALGLYWQY
jgi:S-layer homology domain